ncbi:MAG: Na/Pi cotransporter family protein [Magnetococcales bacterium]|nr:Na/Pi cotransporter family protein [Magnetococcales bacterium]
MSASWPAIAQGITGATLYLYGLEKTLFALSNLHGESITKRLGAIDSFDLRGWLAGSGAGALLLSNRTILELLGTLAASNLLACRQTLLLLLGSLAGTSLLVLLLAAIPSYLAVLPLAVGPMLLYATTRAELRFIGHLLLGVGLLFLGLATLEETMRHASFLGALLTHPWIPLVATLVAATILGSSHAVIGLLLVLTGSGLLSLPAALAMSLAANLGAALPFSALLQEQSAQIKRLFMAHLIFQGTGVLLVAWWLPQAGAALNWLPVTDGWRLVIFHLFFNGLVSLAGLPLLRPLTDLAHRLLPDPYGTEVQELDFTERYWPRYLDDDLLDTPTLALAMARREVGLIAAMVEEMLTLVPEALFTADPQVIARMRKMDDRVDEIHRAVTRYLAGIGGANLTPQAAGELMAAMTVANELEAIGDIIENNLGHLTETRLDQRPDFPPEIRTALTDYHHAVRAAFRQAADAFLTDDPTLAREVMARKESISTMDTQNRLEQMRVLRSGAADFTLYTLQMDLYENFKRIFYHAKRIAKVVAGA